MPRGGHSCWLIVKLEFGNAEQKSICIIRSRNHQAVGHTPGQLLLALSRMIGWKYNILAGNNKCVKSCGREKPSTFQRQTQYNSDISSTVSGGRPNGNVAIADLDTE